MTRSRYAFAVNKALKAILATNTLELSVQQLADLKAIEALDANRTSSLLGPEALARLSLISSSPTTPVDEDDHQESVPTSSVKRQKTVETRPTVPSEQVDDETNGPLLDRVIQGRRTRISQSDYERFVRNDKWASCEFFRFEPSSKWSSVVVNMIQLSSRLIWYFFFQTPSDRASSVRPNARRSPMASTCVRRVAILPTSHWSSITCSFARANSSSPVSTKTP